MKIKGTLQGVHQTGQYLNACCLSLWMYLKSQASYLQLVYSIGLILLMRQSSLPITAVIVYPSMNWMSLSRVQLSLSVSSPSKPFDFRNKLCHHFVGKGPFPYEEIHS